MLIQRRQFQSDTQKNTHTQAGFVTLNNNKQLWHLKNQAAFSLGKKGWGLQR